MNCEDEANVDDYSRHSNHNHSHNHGHGHDHDHDSEANNGISDSLYSKIIVDEVRCLNEQQPGSIKATIKPWASRLDITQYVDSDVDSELIVYIPFNGMVKLKSIFIWGGATESAPSSLRIFANRDDVDFDNVGDITEIQRLNLVRGSRVPIEYPVKATKFSSVRDLTLHFPDNFTGDEEQQTRIYYLAFRGEWTEIREQSIVSVYEAKPNYADHKNPAGENWARHQVS